MKNKNTKTINKNINKSLTFTLNSKIEKNTSNKNTINLSKVKNRNPKNTKKTLKKLK